MAENECDSPELAFEKTWSNAFDKQFTKYRQPLKDIV